MATDNKVVPFRLDDKALHTLSVLVTRAQLAARLGYQYQGDRNVYQALGYPEDLTYEDYAARYLRHDIAKAVINRPVEATWRGKLQIVEIGNTPEQAKKETPFEKAFKDLYDKFNLKSVFSRTDKLSGIGRYGCLLLGFDDTRSRDDLQKPVSGTNRSLLYLKPLSEMSAQIINWDTDTASPRYGLPLIYNVYGTDLSNMDPSGSSVSMPTVTMLVHYSRMLHVPGDILEGEIEGIPALEVVYNRLIDLEKLVGASAEMFWRGARPGYKGTVDNDFTLTADAKKDLQDQLDEYEHNLRRFLINEGIDIEALSSQVSDPINHVDIQIQMISAVTGIPKRILVGSERGELASSEDRSSWLETIQGRRDDMAEPQIIRPFIDRCVRYGVLPAPRSQYKIIWPDIFAPSKKDMADIGKTRAAALQSYMNNPAAESIVSAEGFYKYMLGLDPEEVDDLMALHEEASQQAMIEEQAALQKTEVSSTPGQEGKLVRTKPPKVGQ